MGVPRRTSFIIAGLVSLTIFFALSNNESSSETVILTLPARVEAAHARHGVPAPVIHKAPLDVSPDAVRKCASNKLPRFPIVLLLNSLHHESLLACYESNDIVCQTVKEAGHWELTVFYALKFALDTIATSMSPPGIPPVYVDIGGNVGSLAVGVATLNYETYVFEMMPKNMQLLTVSRCVNRLEAVMHLYHMGLGPQEGSCFMVTNERNFGDAALHCDEELPARIQAAKQRGEHSEIQIVDRVGVRPLDAVLAESGFFARMDAGMHVVIKIDVEGSEIMVMRGATRLLSHPNRPRFIFSEVWRLINITRYGEIMLHHGYVGLAFSQATWMKSIGDVARYHRTLGVAIDDVAWVTVEFARAMGGKVLHNCQVPFFS